VKVASHEATPVIAVATKAHPPMPDDPDVGDTVKLTVPVGVEAPLEAVSVTIAVHAVGLPTATAVGEQATVVAVGSTTEVTDVVNV
jgi:hypothetical protein